MYSSLHVDVCMTCTYSKCVRIFSSQPYHAPAASLKSATLSMSGHYVSCSLLSTQLARVEAPAVNLRMLARVPLARQQHQPLLTNPINRKLHPTPICEPSMTHEHNANTTTWHTESHRGLCMKRTKRLERSSSARRRSQETVRVMYQDQVKRTVRYMLRSLYQTTKHTVLRERAGCGSSRGDSYD